MDKLVDYLIMFLKKKTYCQTGVIKNEIEDEVDEKDEEGEVYDVEDDNEEEEIDDDGIDHDEIIFGSVTEIIF